MRKLSTLFGSLVALGALVGCGGTAGPAQISAVTSLTGSASSGQSTYAQNCSSCHGTDAVSGSAHRPLPSLAQSDETRVVNTVLSGQNEMPSFSGALTDQQIADVVAYLKTL